MKEALTAGGAFALFAMVHSLTVSDAFKSFAARITGERWMRAWYRLAFTLFSAAISIIYAAFYLSLPDTFLYRPPWYVLWPMHMVQFAGVWLMVAAMRPFSAGYFSGIAQARRFLESGTTGGDIEGIPDGSLVTGGVYSVVRHPMYLAGILVFMFEPNVTLNCLVVRVLAAGYFVYGALVEDVRLSARFGDEYRRYMERVPRFNIIAGVMRRRDI